MNTDPSTEFWASRVGGGVRPAAAGFELTTSSTDIARDSTPAARDRRSNRASYSSFLTTATLIVALTPRPSFTGTSKSPSAWIGSAQGILFERPPNPRVGDGLSIWRGLVSLQRLSSPTVRPRRHPDLPRYRAAPA